MELLIISSIITIRDLAFDFVDLNEKNHSFNGFSID